MAALQDTGMGTGRTGRVPAALRTLAIVAAGLAALLIRPDHRPAPTPAARITAAPADWVDPTFGRVMLYRPAGPPRGLVLFLSGDGGWRGVVDRMARQLAAHGALVAGLSTGRLLRHVEAEARPCAAPSFPLLGIAADIEHRAGFPRYRKPLLVGYSAGATLAYGVVAQAPGGSYAGATSIAFSPDIAGIKPWCPTAGVTVARIGSRGSLFAPRPLSVPWTVIQGTADAVVRFGVAQRFAIMAHARLVALPGVGHDFADAARWSRPLTHAVLPLFPPPASPGTSLPADLPLTLVTDPAAPATDRMAVLWSGDGGWAGLDREVAARLARAGVPVVGVDSLAYFWTARTPQGTARDLMRIMAGYSRLWHRPRVLLIGYSFGADILPEVVGALHPDYRAHVARLGLIGLGTSADFQFHLGAWLDVAGPAARPTLPAMAALRGRDMVCLRGRDETDSACPLLPPGLARAIVLPGGHHLGGDADAIARAILYDGRT
ncbi:MAG TPA: AcvB/VirJ family lysyl-phosphatidylglycerol hydrolase [Sphingomonas sp.]|jgi:type IV secretory pathway VirJ component|uniref:AcvB/VirJ family lysyl-phosphatidylglycerol hydrolase n=1 Tax=Sphingomonas sp. TaxID=28214 RepID=UPI002EDADF7D